MTHRQTRFGILGTGRITRRLVADLQSTRDVTVTAIASRSAERARWSAGQYGIENAVEGYTELLHRDDVDAVYVALPPSMHTDACVQAAERGKHLLCEKPLTTSLEDAKRIDEACRTAGVRWLDATGWLHHKRTAEMLTLAQDGSLGKLAHISVAISFYRPFQTGEHRLDPKLGGGCLLDLGWYAAGLSIRFASGLPKRVFASSIEESGVPLRVNAMLWFDDDVTAAFSCGYDSATRKWFEVAGSEASVICDDFSRPWTDRPTRFWVHGAGGEVTSHTTEDQQEQRLIETLLSDASLDPFQTQALRTQTVLDALAQSIQSGVPVNVAFDES